MGANINSAACFLCSSPHVPEQREGLPCVKAIFAGSFDPPTFGHLDLVLRARSLFAEVHVLVAVNVQKRYLLSECERVDLMRQVLGDRPGVYVFPWRSLVVTYARDVGARVLVRGVRNATDFCQEFDLAWVHRALDAGLETVFLATKPCYAALRSSMVREVASFGGDVSTFVPRVVARLLQEKFTQA